MMRTKEQVQQEATQLALQLGAARFERAMKERAEAQIIEQLARVDAEMGQILAVEKAIADAAQPPPTPAAAPAPPPESTAPTPPG